MTFHSKVCMITNITNYNKSWRPRCIGDDEGWSRDEFYNFIVDDDQELARPALVKRFA
jgi:hypothetical protein